jgi:hypothetical protein
MSNHALPTRASRPLQRLCLAIVLAFCAPTSLSTARADVTSIPCATSSLACQAPLGWTWRSVLSPLDHILGDQKAMIRFGTVAFISALYIIWWRK